MAAPPEQRHLFPQLVVAAERLIEGGALAGRDVVLFGAGHANILLKALLEEHGVATSAVVDNDSRKVGTDFFGVTVSAPYPALSPHRDDVAILVSSPFFADEIVYQLGQLGYTPGREVFVLDPGPGLTPRDFLGKVARTLRGARVYLRLRHRGLRPATVLLAPYTGIGDTYLIGRYFHAHLRRFGVRRYVFAVTSARSREAAELFGIDDIVVVSREESQQLREYATFARTPSHRFTTLYQLADQSCKGIDGYKGLTFDQSYRYLAMGLDDTDAPDQPLDLSDPRTVADFFADNGLTPGKTLVLAPYSNGSIPLSDPQFWRGLAAEFTGRGFTVCTVSNSPKEPVVEGTVGVTFPIRDTIAILDRAGYFLALRSGLCDVASGSTCKKVVLYAGGVVWFRSTWSDYFSLRTMALSDDVVELEFRPHDLSGVATRIVEALT